MSYAVGGRDRIELASCVSCCLFDFVYKFIVCIFDLNWQFIIKSVSCLLT